MRQIEDAVFMTVRRPFFYAKTPRELYVRVMTLLELQEMLARRPTTGNHEVDLVENRFKQYDHYQQIPFAELQTIEDAAERLAAFALEESGRHPLDVPPSFTNDLDDLLRYKGEAATLLADAAVNLDDTTASRRARVAEEVFEDAKTLFVRRYGTRFR